MKIISHLGFVFSAIVLVACNGNLESESSGSTSGAGGSSTHTPCVPGDSSACACTDGTTSAQVCNDQGTAFGPCVCDTSSSSSTSTSSSSTTGVGGSAAFTPPCNGNWEALPSLFPNNMGAEYVGGVDQYAFGVYDDNSSPSGRRGLIAKVDPASRTLTQVTQATEFSWVFRMVKLTNGDFAILGSEEDGSFAVVTLQNWQHAYDSGPAFDMCGSNLDDLYLLGNDSGAVLTHVGTNPYQVRPDTDQAIAVACIGDSVFVSTSRQSGHEQFDNARLFKITDGNVTELQLQPGTASVVSIAGPDPDHVYISYYDDSATEGGHLGYLVNGLFQANVQTGSGALGIVSDLQMVGNAVSGTTATQVPLASGGERYYANAAFFDASLSPNIQSLDPLLTEAFGIWQAADGTTYAAGYANGDQVVMCHQ